MANSGIDPTHVYFLNDHPTQIPPSEILGPVVQNCQIFSSMAMAMSIYGTLCVLVSLKISLLEMPIAFGNEHLKIW